MKIRLTDLACIVGIALILAPSFFDFYVSISYIGYLVAAILLSIAGYDAQAHMLGRGHPGEKLLQDAWGWIKTKLKKCGLP